MQAAANLDAMAAILGVDWRGAVKDVPLPSLNDSFLPDNASLRGLAEKVIDSLDAAEVVKVSDFACWSVVQSTLCCTYLYGLCEYRSGSTTRPGLRYPSTRT